MPELNSRLQKLRRLKIILSPTNHRSSMTITTTKVPQLLLTTLLPGVMITCMLGFRTHSGMVAFGSPGSSVSRISTEAAPPMGKRSLFQTTFGIQRGRDLVQLILQEGTWETPRRIGIIR